MDQELFGIPDHNRFVVSVNMQGQVEVEYYERGVPKGHLFDDWQHVYIDGLDQELFDQMRALQRGEVRWFTSPRPIRIEGGRELRPGKLIVDL